jgi:DNA-binding IclR family transcriptional regulator
MAAKKTNNKEDVKDGVAAVERALSILTAFDRGVNTLSLAEISGRTGLYKSTALRLIQSLIRYDFLRRSPDGQYHIGPTLLVLGSLYQRGLRLGDAVLPAMRDVANLSGEGVSFYILSGDKRLCLYRVDSKHEVRDHIREGDLLPLDKGSGGRVLCAFVNKKGDLYDSIRRRYLYASYGERDNETAGISAPVFGAGGAILGVLTLAGPRSRVDAAFIEKMRLPLMNAAIAATVHSGGDTNGMRQAMGSGFSQRTFKEKSGRRAS